MIVFVCQPVVRPEFQSNLFTNHVVGSLHVLIRPILNICVPVLIVASDTLTSKDRVSVCPASTGTFVPFATRHAGLSVVSAFCVASNTGAPSPEPDNVHDEMLAVASPFSSKLPVFRRLIRFVVWFDVVSNLPSAAVTRWLARSWLQRWRCPAALRSTRWRRYPLRI